MNPSVVRKMSPKPVSPPVGDSLTIDQRIDTLFDLFDKHGQMNYVGENVTQMQHAQEVQAVLFQLNHCFSMGTTLFSPRNKLELKK